MNLALMKVCVTQIVYIAEMQLVSKSPGPPCKLQFSIFLSVEDPPVIDTDSDPNRSEDDADKDSGQQISDCDSDPCDEDEEGTYLTSTNVSKLLFSVYSLTAISAGTILMYWHSCCFLRKGTRL